MGEAILARAAGSGGGAKVATGIVYVTNQKTFTVTGLPFTPQHVAVAERPEYGGKSDKLYFWTDSDGRRDAITYGSAYVTTTSLVTYNSDGFTISVDSSSYYFNTDTSYSYNKYRWWAWAD